MEDKVEILEDTYISWLVLVNAGMLTPGNIWCFNYAIQNLPSSNPILEIGSFCGLSTNVISYFKLRNNRINKLICVDPWKFEGSEKALGHPIYSHVDYRNYVKESYIRNVSTFSSHDLPSMFELASNDFFIKWSNKEESVNVVQNTKELLGGPISFAYIDGNHTYEYAREDFENVDRFLENGGFILFDDSGDGSGWEVCRVIEEVKQMDRYELVKKNPNYLFRKTES